MAAPAMSAPATVGDWRMNEGPAATVMVDQSGRGHNGAIGDKVQPGQSLGSGVGYTFPSPQVVSQDRSRLVVVSSRAALNPGESDVQLTVRIQTSGAGEGNLMQKGQAGAPGGFYKVEITKGRPGCYFRGSLGTREAWWPTKINDGNVHTIECHRRSNRVDISVNGQPSVTKWGRTGSISNAAPLVLGGKYSCNPGAGNECDYYTGKLSNLRLTIG
jgi:hypothetical protein